MNGVNCFSKVNEKQEFYWERNDLFAKCQFTIQPKQSKEVFEKCHLVHLGPLVSYACFFNIYKTALYVYICTIATESAALCAKTSCYSPHFL